MICFILQVCRVRGKKIVFSVVLFLLLLVFWKQFLSRDDVRWLSAAFGQRLIVVDNLRA